jgi:4-hydroxy-3-methylbut-2-enyl diphosphate reductase
MKFTTAAILSLGAITTSSAFLLPAVPSITTTRQTTVPTVFYSTTEDNAQERKMSKKKGDRLAFMKNEQFHRRGFKEVREGVESSIQEQFQSKLVDEFKSSNYVIEKDGVKVYLAKVRTLVWIATSDYPSSLVVLSTTSHPRDIYIYIYIFFYS